MSLRDPVSLQSCQVTISCSSQIADQQCGAPQLAMPVLTAFGHVYCKSAAQRVIMTCLIGTEILNPTIYIVRYSASSKFSSGYCSHLLRNCTGQNHRLKCPCCFTSAILQVVRCYPGSARSWASQSCWQATVCRLAQCLKTRSWPLSWPF